MKEERLGWQNFYGNAIICNNFLIKGIENMKKWLLIALCMSVLVGCSRYTPIEITQEENQEQREKETAVRDEAKAEETVPEVEQECAIHIKDESQKRRTLKNRVKVKGIYISAYVAGNQKMMDQIIQKIDETELNAVIIDFKDDSGRITTSVSSELFNEIDACKNYVPDMKELLSRLKEHEIYTIARVVTFRDPYLAEKKPEWSLKKKDGSLYRDKKGMAWVNPYKKEVWDYMVEAGKQAAALGFDEVQFDYIRFATDAGMREVKIEETDLAERSKTDIITEFTAYAYENLIPSGVFVSADVFGAIIGSEADAQSVGQSYSEMAGKLDYICPMIYPSHYGEGNFGLDYPDMHPYETILAALQKSKEELEPYQQKKEVKATVRPWLQDFTASYLKHHIRYGNEEIRKQIQAVYDAGYEEWILWSASGRYHYGGLEPEKEAAEENQEKN